MGGRFESILLYKLPDLFSEKTVEVVIELFTRVCEVLTAVRVMCLVQISIVETVQAQISKPQTRFLTCLAFSNDRQPCFSDRLAVT